MYHLSSVSHHWERLHEALNRSDYPLSEPTQPPSSMPGAVACLD